MATEYETTFDEYLQLHGFNPSLVAIAPKISGSISMVSSCYVVQDILRSPEKRSRSTYHRVMLGLAIADILSSVVGSILSTWPIPKGYHLFAVGSMATCDTVGFLNALTIFATPVYYCSLTTYYLVQLRYNWLDREIKAIEKWLHIVPWTVGLMAAVTGLATNSYGPTVSTCWFTEAYPIGCDDPDSEIECDRGNPLAYKILTTICVAMIILSIIYVIVTMSMVYRKIRDIERKALRYTFTFLRESQVDCWKRSRRVMFQGILYTVVLVFINLFFLISVLLVALIGKHVVIILKISALFLYPLQGFFNSLIYAIPAFQRLHSRLSKKGKKFMQSTMETFRSTALYSLLQRSKNTKKDGDDDSKHDEEDEDKANNMTEEVDSTSLPPIERHMIVSELIEEEKQECVPSLDYPTSSREERIKTAIILRQEQQSGSSIYYSLKDIYCKESDESKGDSDDYLSLRFFTEEQRENSGMSVYQNSCEDSFT